MREYRNKSLKPVELKVRPEVEETEGPSIINRLKNKAYREKRKLKITKK